MADGDASQQLRYRFQVLMDRERTNPVGVASRLQRVRTPLATQTVYNAVNVSHVPHMATLTAICNVLHASTDEILAMTQLRDAVSDERKTDRPAEIATSGGSTALAGQSEFSEADALIFRRFDGRTGHQQQEMKWTYFIGDDPSLDRVLERRRIWVDGRTPLESIKTQPGSAHSLNVTRADLAPAMRILDAPSGTPDDLACHVFLGRPRGDHIDLLGVLSAPVLDQGWLDVEMSYRWPGLWDSLRDPAERSSCGFNGFVGDVTVGAVEFVWNRPFRLGVEHARCRSQTLVHSGVHRAEYRQDSPSRFVVQLTC